MYFVTLKTNITTVNINYQTDYHEFLSLWDLYRIFSYIYISCVQDICFLNVCLIDTSTLELDFSSKQRY
jgi:hypothetical protein